MTCRDAIEVIADFLDHALTPAAARELDRHLEGCEPCRAYLNTYRTTRLLVRDAGHVELPPELKRRLREFLIEQLGRPLT